MPQLRGWTLPDRGALFVVTGPSGVGKSILIRSMMETVPGVDFSVSATTRAPRLGEVDGRDYHFVTGEAFERLADAGELLEHARVYDNRYGTPRAPVEAALAGGRSILLDIDVRGARQVRKTMPEAVSVYILPPGVEALEARLRARGTDDEGTIQRRMAQVDEQLADCGAYDFLVVNDDLEAAKLAFQAIFIAELSRRSRREALVRAVDASLARRLRSGD